MKRVKLMDGMIMIPKKYQLSTSKRKLVVVTPYLRRYSKLEKDNHTIAEHYSLKGHNRKLFIEEGYVLIDGDRFKIQHGKNKNTND